MEHGTLSNDHGDRPENSARGFEAFQALFEEKSSSPIYG